jgi:serine/threonine protein kinase
MFTMETRINQPPLSVGKYKIIEEIGRGGFAVVYKARDITNNRIVALKVLAQHLAWDSEYCYGIPARTLFGRTARCW